MPWYANPLLAEVAAAERAAIPWYLHLIVALGTILISFFLGNYLAKKFRMPDYGWRIGLCLFSLLASLAILWMGPPIKYGVDLSGGAILIYEVDKTKTTPNETVDMDKLVAAVGRRVNPGGQKEVTIRKYGVEQIEIIVPEIDETKLQQIERIISTTGNLEFRILANQRNDKEVIERALAEPSKRQLTDAQGNVVAWWLPVKEGEERSFASYGDIGRRTKKIGNREVMEILVVKDIYNVTGAYLSRAEVGTDRKGQPCVNFTFTEAGGQLFGGLTGDHLPDKLTDFTYKLGIVLDGQLYSAPSIQSTITTRGEITGSFTRQEVQDLVNVLNAGSLPAALTKEPISKLFSGATLGNDTIERSKNAMIISSILVPLFMLVYYRFCGVVAVIALALNMLILIAIMISIKAAFTLTGFAGLALTVGMAVDNNVLIYERLREELDRGATLRMAIRNAFNRVTATIVDCNSTHLIVATVLYMVGSDQLRGFAVPLWLGTAISIFTAVFVSHVILQVAEKRQWLTELKMRHLIGHTNIDFMGWFPYCFAGSLIISVVAIGASFLRGQGLFDIDFTGGSSVQAQFEEPQDTARIRHMLSEKLPDLAVSDVRVIGEKSGLRFDINTSERELPKVKGVLSEVFGGELARNSVTVVGEPKVVEAKQPAPESPKKDAPKAEPAKDAVKNKQSRNDLPPSTLLASADPDAVMLALADAPAKTPEKPADAKPAGTPKAEAKAPAKAETPPKPAAPAEAAKSPAAAEAAKPAVATVDPYVGGTEVELKFGKPINHRAAEELIRTALEAQQIAMDAAVPYLSNPKYEEGDSTAFDRWNLKVLLPVEKTKALLKTLEEQVADSPIFPASSNIGAAVAGNTQVVAVYALIASWIGIILYLWVRFQGVAFGLAAVIALIHDVIVMLGGIAVSIYVAPYLGFLMIEPFKINLPIVAAFLTIIGYSVNDTIVVFDRIREVRGKNPDMTAEMVNESTNQTLSRTLLTSFTVLLVVVVLYFFGGDALHGFAFALVIGVLTGTYSSIYVAAPILLWLIGKHKQLTT